MRALYAGWTLLLVIVIFGCHRPGTAVCGDFFCPTDKVCAPSADVCVFPGQLNACEGQAEGDVCSFGAGTGVCLEGLCLGGTCDNAVLELTEDCEPRLDTGLTCTDFGFYEPEGLACSAACRFDTESCGGGYCGDGVKDGPELCDGSTVDACTGFGSHWGRLACSDFCAFDFSRCGRFNWTLEQSNTSADLHDVWGRAADDVFAVGELGTIVHFDGTQWQVAPSSTGLTLKAVHGLASEEVYAVGGQNESTDVGISLHFDGATWSEMAPPPGYLASVFAVGQGDVFAGSTHGRIFRFRGDSWELTRQSELVLYTVRAVWGTSATHVIAGGGVGDVWQFDGDQWSSIGNLPGAVSALHGTDPSNVYAVTEGAADSGLYHYDGVNWSKVPSLDTPGPTSMRDVHVNSGGAVIAVDSVHPSLYKKGVLAVPFGGTASLAVWSAGPGHTYSVGLNGAIWRNNGTGVGEAAPLNSWAVWAAPGGDVVAVGGQDVVGCLQPDGWTETPVDGFPPLVRAIHGSDVDNIFLSVNSKIFHYDCATLTYMHSFPTNVIHVLAADSVIALGNSNNSGAITRYDGTDWVDAMVSADPYSLVGLWASAHNDVYVVGSESNKAPGVIMHDDGNGFQRVDDRTLPRLAAVWGTAADNVYAVGDKGVITHFDGTSWTRMDSGTAT